MHVSAWTDRLNKQRNKETSKHPEIQPFKKGGENQAGPLFTIVNCGCMDGCSRIGPLCFHLCISGLGTQMSDSILQQILKGG
tara:strand:- start:30 stop:275 length:246 start_codon:yes stop_codon:yes gene_type:complete